MRHKSTAQGQSAGTWGRVMETPKGLALSVQREWQALGKEVCTEVLGVWSFPRPPWLGPEKPKESGLRGPVGQCQSHPNFLPLPEHGLLLPQHPTWSREWPGLSASPWGPSSLCCQPDPGHHASSKTPPTCASSNPPVPKAPPSFYHSPLLQQTFLCTSYKLGPHSHPGPTTCQTQLRASGQWLPGMQFSLHPQVKSPALF